jgi:O-antigen ligase
LNKIESWLDKTYLWGFICFLLVVPFEKHVVKAIFLILFMIWIFSSIKKFGFRFIKEMMPDVKFNLAILFFLISASVSTIFSGDSYYSQKILFGRYLLFMIFFWMSYGLIKNSIRNVYPIIVSFLALGIFIGMGGIWDYSHLHPERLFTTFGKGIFMTIFLPFFFPLSFALYLHSKNRLLKYLSFITLFALLPALVFNGSRLAWISVAVSLIFTATFNFKIKSIFLLVLMLLISILLSPKTDKVRARSLLNPLSRETLSDRVDLKNRALSIFKHHFFIGAGPGLFKQLYSPPAGHEDQQSFIHSHAHNTYLEVAAEMGILGLGAFLTIIVVFFKNFFVYLRRISDDLKPIYLGMTGVVFALLFTALGGSIILVGFQDSLLFWFFLGAVSAIKQGEGNGNFR